jgi:hypothetical protein
LEPVNALSVLPAVVRRDSSVSAEYGRYLQFTAGKHILPYRLFISLVTWRIEDPSNKFIRQILLCNPVVAVCMRVQVAGAVTESFGIAACITEMIRHFRIFFFHRRKSASKNAMLLFAFGRC